MLLLKHIKTKNTKNTENFANVNNSRYVRYGDIITIWGWSNSFMRFNYSTGLIDVGMTLQSPQNIPRSGWGWEPMILEDPKEISMGVNNNTNPIKYGDKILIRSTYIYNYIGINPSTNSGYVIPSSTRDIWVEMEILSTDTSGKSGQYINYGDHIYLKTASSTYLRIMEDNSVQHSTTQDSKCLMMIYDGWGQGVNMDWGRRGTAYQSSISGNYIANNAIDGNIQTYNHTQNDNNAWWEVKLPKDIYITEIKITNRKDCCQDRLSNFDVYVLDDNNNTITSKYYKACGDSVIWNNIFNIGRKVKIQLRDKNFLHISEVNIYGAPVDYSLLMDKPLSIDIINKPYTLLNNSSLSYNMADLPSVKISKNLSIAFFVKPVDISQKETVLFSKGSNSTEMSPAITFMQNSTRLKLYYGINSSVSKNIENLNTLPLNKWTHITYIISCGVSENTGWQLCLFNNNIKVEPYNKCCYYINTLLKEYYYTNNSEISSKTTNSNIFDESILNNMKYMGELDIKMTSPYIKLYINGILKIYENIDSIPHFNSGPLIFGNNDKINITASNSILDQFKYYNYVLSNDQILHLMQTPLNNISKTLVYKLPNSLMIDKFQPNEIPYINNNITILFWLYLKRPINGTGNIDQLFLKGNDKSDNSIGIYMNDMSNTLKIIVNSAEIIPKSTTILNTNSWTHIALNISDTNLKLYINGLITDQLTLPNTPVYNNEPVYIGGVEGEIYNLQMSNFDMDEDQIKTIMGYNPDMKYLNIINNMWKKIGCITPLDISSKNTYKWIELLKTNNVSEISSQMSSIISSANTGDKNALYTCFGDYTAKLKEELDKKEELLKYTLTEDSGKKCLPTAPFSCKNQSINDFDIKTHKDYINNSYINDMKAELENTHKTIVGLEKKLKEQNNGMPDKTLSLKVQEQQDTINRLQKLLNNNSNKNNISMEDIKSHPIFTSTLNDLKNNNNMLSQCNNSLENALLQSKKTLTDLENNKKITSTILKKLNNLNLNDANIEEILKNNPNSDKFNTIMNNLKTKNDELRCWNCNLPSN